MCYLDAADLDSSISVEEAFEIFHNISITEPTYIQGVVLDFSSHNFQDQHSLLSATHE